MDPLDVSPTIPANQVFCVRGKETFLYLKNIGIPLRDIPLGDPGFLAPNAFKMENVARNIYPVGLIPHYADARHDSIISLSRQPGVKVLDVHSDPLVFLSELVQCSVIISSSLHGLIFAEAYRIPNLWIRVSDVVFRTGFKFRDWNSTLRRPQVRPHILGIGDKVETLSRMAQLHDCEVCDASLMSAFPRSRLGELTSVIGRSSYRPINSCRKSGVPAFIISFNRPRFLLRCIKSIRRLRGIGDIIVHDNGSDDPATLRLLQRLNRIGIMIYNRPKINNAGDLNDVNETVQNYFSTWAFPTEYIVTDCDIELDGVNDDLIEVFSSLLVRYREAECVGPMLRIADIPKTYQNQSRFIPPGHRIHTNKEAYG
jgi:hypothetical protein